VKRVTVPFFISHQGCPHTCAFCDQRAISGSAGALPSAEEIVAKVGQWHTTSAGQPLEVAFFGGSFTALSVAVQDDLLRPLQVLLADGTVAGIRISTRPDYIDPAIVHRLKRQGVTVVELGVQSMDDGVLAAAGRGHDAAVCEAAIRTVRAGGLAVGAQLMPGLPGDTPAKSLRSLRRVIAAGAQFLRLYPVVVLAGTELADRFHAGKYQPPGLREGVQTCKMLLHEALRAGVPTVRIGLQADDGLHEGSVLAGCWHPALGQLVGSALYGDLLEQLLAAVPHGQQATVCCHPSRFSDVIGHGRSNLRRLGERGTSLTVRGDAMMKQEELTIQTPAGMLRGDVIHDLNYECDEE
jgi:histone acetyltransferase (RNA polymerase elongator complex component)